MSERLILRELTVSDEAAFLSGLSEWEGEDLSWYTLDWTPGMSYAESLAKLRDGARGIGLPDGYVPATMLYGFVGAAIVGRVQIRHALNESLRRRGGHVGYAVAPRHRRRGYAVEMVRQALPVCATLGLADVMITCADDNEPSWRIVEKLGGRLEDKVRDDVEEELVRRYWLRVPSRGLK
jgi:predicted acetyltransferase